MGPDVPRLMLETMKGLFAHGTLVGPWKILTIVCFDVIALHALHAAAELGYANRRHSRCRHIFFFVALTAVSLLTRLG